MYNRLRVIKVLFFSLFVVLFLIFTANLKIQAAGNPFGAKVNVTTIVGKGEENSNQTQMTNQSHGDRNLNIDLSALTSSYEFAYYIANGKIISDINHKFVVSSNLQVVSVLKPSDKYVATFLDTNGKLIGYDYVSANETPEVPPTDGLSKPGYTINTSNPWSEIVGPMNSDKVYVVNYEKVSSAQVTITVVNGNGAGDYEFNELVTISTDDPNFTHWIDNSGQVISFENEIRVTAISDRTFTAVTTALQSTPVVSFTDVTGIKEGRNSYLGQYYLSEGYQLVEAGFLFSDVYSGTLTIDTPNVDIVQSNIINEESNEFLRSVIESNSRYARAYLVATNTLGEVEVFYSSISVPENNQSLMIWEINTGGGNNNATYDRDFVVLYNASNHTLDLSGYTIQYGSANGEFALRHTLSGEIEAKSYYVVADMNAGTNGSPLPVKVDEFTESLGFGATNGKVAIASTNDLVSDTTSSNLVDLIGYGTATTFETEATAALSATTSAKRNSSIDTNNNSSDFTVGALDLAYLPINDVFYKIEFNSNGGSSVSSIENITTGRKATEPANPTNGDYEFIGWFEDEGLTIPFDFNKYINKNYTLYAKWYLFDYYTVTFNVNGGIEANYDISVKEGNLVPAQTNPTHVSKKFNGWFYGDDRFNFDTPVIANITLIANWVEDGAVEPTEVTFTKVTTNYTTTEDNETTSFAS